MRIIKGLIAVSFVAGLAACSNPGTPPQTTGATTSSAPAAASQSPQPAGALPEGSTVNAPISSPGGDVTTKTVNPNTLKRR